MNDIEKLEEEYGLKFFKKMFSNRYNFVNFIRYTKYSIGKKFTRKRKVQDLTVQEAKEKYDRGDLVFLDVREPSDYESANIKGSINMEVGKIKKNLTQLPGDKEIGVLCYGGGVSQVVVKLLLKKGFHNSKNIKGGMIRWALEIDQDLLGLL
jgi:rhodanese-related sulfurtransferase